MPLVTTAFAALALITLAGPAAAYLGPGAGLGAIGAVVALLAAVALAVVGFVWYPIKRVVAASRARRRPVERDATER